MSGLREWRGFRNGWLRDGVYGRGRCDGAKMVDADLPRGSGGRVGSQRGNGRIVGYLQGIGNSII